MKDKQHENKGFKRFFESTNMTRKEFSRRVGIPESTISLWFCGLRSVTYSSAVKISDAFMTMDISPNQLTGEGHSFNFIAEMRVLVMPKDDGSFDIRHVDHNNYKINKRSLTSDSLKAIKDIINEKI